MDGLLILFCLGECLSQPLLFRFARRFVVGNFIGQACVFLSGARDKVSELALFKAETLVLLGQVNEVFTVALEANFQVLDLSCLVPRLLLVVSSEICLRLLLLDHVGKVATLQLEVLLQMIDLPLEGEVFKAEPFCLSVRLGVCRLL